MKTELKQRIVGGIVLVVMVIVLLPFLLRGKHHPRQSVNDTPAISEQRGLNNDTKKIELSLASAQSADTKQDQATDDAYVGSKAQAIAHKASKRQVFKLQDDNTINVSDDDIQTQQTTATSSVPTSKPTESSNAVVAEQTSAMPSLDETTATAYSTSQSNPSSVSSAATTTAAIKAPNTAEGTIESKVDETAKVSASDNNKSQPVTATPKLMHPAFSQPSAVLSDNASSATTTAAKPQSASVPQKASMTAAAVVKPTAKKTTTKPVASTKPVTLAQGRWMVQAASFSQPANAQRLLRQLRASGFKQAYSREVNLKDGRHMFQVLVGPLTYQRALQTRQQIKQRYHLNGIVRKS